VDEGDDGYTGCAVWVCVQALSSLQSDVGELRSGTAQLKTDLLDKMAAVEYQLDRMAPM